LTLRRAAIEARLRRLQNVIRRLRKLRETPLPQFCENEDTQWLAERGLHLGCEIVLDVGAHLLSGAFGRPAETYEQILSGLGREGVLSPELVEEVGGLGGFRNILVHAYLDLDPERVWAVLQRAPDRFEQFAREVIAWLPDASGGPRA
jgi:uncharacterized protein YutE (UPF0331/DUF86 family)